MQKTHPLMNNLAMRGVTRRDRFPSLKSRTLFVRILQFIFKITGFHLLIKGSYIIPHNNIDKQ